MNNQKPGRTGFSTIPATPAGLEPVTSAVTGRRSNQLSYGAVAYSFKQPSSYITQISIPRK